MSDDNEHYYRILGLRPDASPEEVRHAYRDLVKLWHPDQFADEGLKQRAGEKLKEINEAYKRLKHQRPRQANNASEARAESPKRGASPRSATPKVTEKSAPPIKKRRWLGKREVLAAGLAAAFILAVIHYSPEPTGPFLHVSFDHEVDTDTSLEAQSGNEADQLDSGDRTPRRTERLVSEFRIALPRSFQFNYFTLGSTREEVRSVQGPPDQEIGEIFHYGTSQVHFQDGKVVSWVNNYPRLKVHLRGAPTKKTSYTVGTPRDEVIAIQGTPERFTDSVFHYGMSEVRFRQGRVVGWLNNYPRLKVEMLPVTATTKSRFTVGATRDEVLAIQGTPDSFTDDALRYGTSEVLFQNGRVVSWTNGFPLLKIEEAPPGTPSPSGGRGRG